MKDPVLISCTFYNLFLKELTEGDQISSVLGCDLMYNQTCRLLANQHSSATSVPQISFRMSDRDDLMLAVSMCERFSRQRQYSIAYLHVPVVPL